MILLSLLLAAEVKLDFNQWFQIDVRRPAQAEQYIGDRVSQLLKPSKYSEYANVIADNIFIVDEVKPAEAVATVEKPVAVTQPKRFAMHLEITGIVITPGKEMVMVWDKQNKQSHVLTKNEKLNEWRVVYIDRNKVNLLSDSGDTHEFILNEETLATPVE